jgi:hypothetical protein
MTAWRLLTRSRTNNILLSLSRPNTRLVPQLYAIPRRHVSPFDKFVESIKTQIEKNEELQQNVKLLQDETEKISESDAVKKAKELYTKAKVAIIHRRVNHAFIYIYLSTYLTVIKRG